MCPRLSIMNGLFLCVIDKVLFLTQLFVIKFDFTFKALSSDFKFVFFSFISAMLYSFSKWKFFILSERLTRSPKKYLEKTASKHIISYFKIMFACIACKEVDL